MIRRLLILITIVAGLGALVAVPASADSASAAPDAKAGLRAIKSYDCSLLPGKEVLCGSGTTTSAYANIRISYTWKRYNHAIGAKAVRCTGGDLGPWVKLITKGHIYTLVSSIPNGVCFKVKWGRSWASGVQGNLYY